MKKRKELELIRRAQAAMQKSNAELIRQNQKFREALKHIHGMANEGLRTDDGGSYYWSIEAEAVSALGLSAKERDIGLPEVPEPCITIGDMERDLLKLLMVNDLSHKSIAQCGYLLTMLRLQSCDFVRVSASGWVSITDLGRAYYAQKMQKV